MQDIQPQYCSQCGKEISGRGTTGLCIQCAQQASRVVDRPEPRQLAEEIVASSFLAVGRKYGVSDNAIRK